MVLILQVIFNYYIGQKQLKIKNFYVLMRDEIKDFKSVKLPLNLIVNIDPKKRRREYIGRVFT